MKKNTALFLIIIATLVIFLPLPSLAAPGYELYWSSSESESYNLDLTVSNFEPKIYAPGVPVGANMYPWPASDSKYPSWEFEDLQLEVDTLGWYELSGTTSRTVSSAFNYEPIVYECFEKAVFVIYLDYFEVDPLADFYFKIEYNLAGDVITETRRGAELIDQMQRYGFCPIIVKEYPHQGSLTFTKVSMNFAAGVEVNARFAFALYNGLGLLDFDKIPTYCKPFYQLRTERYTTNFDQWNTVFASADTDRYVQGLFEVSVTVPIYSYHDYLIDFNFGFAFSEYNPEYDGWLKLVNLYTYPSQDITLAEQKITYDRGDRPDVPYPSSGFPGAVPHWANVQAAFQTKNTSLIPDYVTFYFVFALDPIASGLSYCSTDNRVYFVDNYQGYWEDLVGPDWNPGAGDIIDDALDQKDQLDDFLNDQKDYFENQIQNDKDVVDTYLDFLDLDRFLGQRDLLFLSLQKYYAAFYFWGSALGWLSDLEPFQHLLYASVFITVVFMIFRIVSVGGSGFSSIVRRNRAEKRRESAADRRESVRATRREAAERQRNMRDHYGFKD